MNENFGTSQWSHQEGKKEDSESQSRTLNPNLYCVRSCALANYIAENLLSADLKWSLFCAACNSYRFDSVLKPFPPFFLLQEDKQIDQLRKAVELCPSMNNVLKQLRDNTLPTVVKDLLYWVLIHLNEPSFKYIVKEEHQDIISQVPSDIPATMPDYIFAVNYGSRHQEKFAVSASNLPIKQAFHGSRLDNFYSIVNYGLQVSFNKVAAFGPGIYLSSEMILSLPYSPRGFTWGSSFFGSHISILALCDVIDHPDVKSENDFRRSNVFEMNNRQPVSGKYLIVENSDLVRIKYLLLYSSEDSESASLMESPTIIGWIKRHKMFTFVVAYIILLLAIGSSNSSLLYRYYKRITRRFNNPDRQWILFDLLGQSELKHND